VGRGMCSMRDGYGEDNCIGQKKPEKNTAGKRVTVNGGRQEKSTGKEGVFFAAGAGGFLGVAEESPKGRFRSWAKQSNEAGRDMWFKFRGSAPRWGKMVDWVKGIAEGGLKKKPREFLSFMRGKKCTQRGL